MSSGDSVKDFELFTVGEDSWNNWRSMLIRELYEKSTHILEQGEFKLPLFHSIIAEHKGRIRDLLSDFAEDEVEHFLESLPERYFLSTPSDRFYDHFKSFSEFAGEPLVGVKNYPEGRYSEVMVICNDSHALFSKIAGVIAAHNVNILSANVATSSSEVVLDTFQVNYLGEAFKDSRKVRSLSDDMREVIKGALDVDTLLALRSRKRRRDEGVVKYRPTRVYVDNETSRHYTIVDIFTYDRVGLLYDITRAISSLGYEIYLSKISTKADQVADVFYIFELPSGKIEDPEKVEELKREIFKALE